MAEGVETASQLDALRQLSCDAAHGYLLAHPVPNDWQPGPPPRCLCSPA
ncbi:MAG TPA: hypothetical protein VNE21_07540 [Mycobacteriales bacterium]|nr:hypothetical protein [Mycobacteriales bacterium]